MKFNLYTRKSIYTGKGESIENQIEMCKEYIFSKFKGVTEEDITIYEDEGFSGKDIDRPGFQRMLNDMKVNKPDYVICYRLDRISRSVSDFSTLIENLNINDVSFICIKEEFDTSKPMGKAMMYIASVFAQLERETLAERVRDNMLLLARTGRWLGGSPPTGYTSEKIQEVILDGKVKTSCKLKENQDELEIVKLIFEKYSELRSLSGVCKVLIKQGIKSPRNETYFSPSTIKQLLQNPVYCTADKAAFDFFTQNGADVCFEEKDCSNKCGLLSYNKRDYRKKRSPRQSIDKWIIAIGKHNGFIPGEKWVAVQKIIADNIPTGKAPALMHNNYSLLSGLIYCEKCGSRMFAKPRTGKGANHMVYDYMCNYKMRGGVELCDCQNINGEQTDDMVCEYLMKYTEESSSIYKLLEKLKDTLTTQETKSPIAEIDIAIKKCNSKMDNLVSTLSQKKLGAAFISRVNDRITELEEEYTTLLKEKKRLEADNRMIVDRETQISTIVAALSSLKNNFDKLTIYDKRVLIKLIVKKIVWDGKDLHIFIDGE